jgi:ABC-type sugar transport system ATPase subunit
MDTTVRVRNLRKSFKGTEVLKGVDFDVRRGEIFALLGSNGAGKTTIVKILSTLLRADGGAAEVCACDVRSQAQRVRERISLTGQFTAIDEILTGRENLMLMAIASGVSYTAFRLFSDVQKGIFERFHSMPIARSSVLWAHILTSLASNAITVVIIFLVALMMGFRSSAGALPWLGVEAINHA